MSKNNLEIELKNILPHAQITETPLPYVGDLRLYLIDENYPAGPFSHQEIKLLLEKTPYWCFCWGSGLGFAKFIFQHQALFKNKTVLDFGSGSGVLAIAAAKAGAKKIIACDLDPLSLQAIDANAQLNQVKLELLDDFFKLDQAVDILLAADVLYDRGNLPLLELFPKHAAQIYIADSRVKTIAPPYQKLFQTEAITVPDLNEFEEFKTVSIYQYIKP